MLGVVHHLGLGPHLGPEPFELPLATAYPLLVTLVVVAGTLAAHAALVRLGFGALFTLPESLVPSRRGQTDHHPRAKVMGVTVTEVARGQEAGSTKE